MKPMIIQWKSGKTVLHSVKRPVPWADLLCSHDTVSIIDANVLARHDAYLPAGPSITITADEGTKSLTEIQRIYECLTDMKVDRNTTILAIGGGITTDIAGFVSATYMRGLPLILVPTTLLCQVDAGLGGKNGVNFRGYKNLIGSFKQPDAIILDHAFLQTLPRVELQNGIAETIKHGCIGDYGLLDLLRNSGDIVATLRSDTPETLNLIRRSMAVKLHVVKRDENERGIRKILNFGHTFGHAIESQFKLPHGQAISIGMCLAADLSVHMRLISKDKVFELKQILKRFELPVKYTGKYEDLLDPLWHDKKKTGSSIDLILLEDIGKPVIQSLSIDELGEMFHDMCQHQ